MGGKFLKQGDEIGMVIQSDSFVIRVLLEQKESGIIVHKDSKNPTGRAEKVETYIRLASDISAVIPGEAPTLNPYATDRSPGCRRDQPKRRRNGSQSAASRKADVR